MPHEWPSVGEQLARWLEVGDYEGDDEEIEEYRDYLVEDVEAGREKFTVIKRGTNE